MPPDRRRLSAAMSAAVDRLRMRYGLQDAANERRLYAVVVKALRAFLARVRRSVVSLSPAGEAPDLGQFPRPQVWDAHLDTVVLPELGQVFDQGWARVPTVDEGRDNPEPYRDAYLRSIRNRLTNYPDQVYEELREQLAQGLAAGEDVRQLRDRVKATLVVEEAATDWEATRIARTEVHAAVNAGTYAAAKAHNERTEERQRKLWISTADERTRPTHRRADRQQVDLIEPFHVGGALLQFPGDPQGPAGEVINCRCSMVTFGQLAADILNQRAERVLYPKGA
ncbi:phage minor head protein [Nonomuraea sp. NPDC050556]|uniref:phage head morphogenesis protein n=1 Tax=Nonomuraea sp. NPDC050556 TaxID=3364369 RepID=UPI0037A999E1